MVLSKPVIKTFLLQLHFLSCLFCINFYKRHVVDVSNDFTTPKAIRCANEASISSKSNGVTKFKIQPPKKEVLLE